jgi:hypothetical protein
MKRFILVSLLLAPFALQSMQDNGHMSNEAIESAFEQVKQQAGTGDRAQFSGILRDLQQKAQRNGAQNLARSLAVYRNRRRAAVQQAPQQGNALQNKFNSLPKSF